MIGRVVKWSVSEPILRTSIETLGFCEELFHQRHVASLSCGTQQATTCVCVNGEGEGYEKEVRTTNEPETKRED
jgi:hypothetical protein